MTIRTNFWMLSFPKNVSRGFLRKAGVGGVKLPVLYHFSRVEY